jgi:OmpA-OmpF porin, OOP family
MKRMEWLIAAALALAAALMPAGTAGAADDSDAKIPASELIGLLKHSETPTKFRGIHLYTSQPGETQKLPGVALDIKFKLNSAELTEGAKAQLDELATAVKSDDLKDRHFVLEGHTDSTGRLDYNRALSKRRAEAVKDFLVNKMGVAADRLEAVGKGSADPADPQDPKGAENRRVVVINQSAS